MKKDLNTTNVYVKKILRQNRKLKIVYLPFGLCAGNIKIAFASKNNKVCSVLICNKLFKFFWRVL